MDNPVLLDALNRLNQIGAAVSQLGSGELGSYQTVLCMITESAAAMVPGSSAVIYTYDERKGAFDKNSRVSVGARAARPDVSADDDTLPTARPYADDDIARATRPCADDNIASAARSSASANHDIAPDAPPCPDEPRPNGLGRRAVESRERVLSYQVDDIQIHPAKVARGARVVACYPLVFTHEVLGVLYIYLHQERRFTDLELLVLGNFVYLAAMTLSLARQTVLAQQEQTRKDRELRRLRRAGMLISSRSSLKSTLEAILQVALEITDASYGIFRLVDRGGSHLVTQAISGIGLEKPAVETLVIDGNSIMGTVAMKREPVIISDLREEPWKAIYYPFDHELEMRSELAVPLIGASGRLEGVLNLESPAVNAFDRQDRYILQILATQAVVAIQEARLLDTLQDISALLTRRSPEIVHQTLVDRACDLLNVSFGMIWLKEKEHLVLKAATDPALRGTRISLTGTLTGQTVEAGRPVSVLMAGPESQSSYPDLPGFAENGSALIVPLGASGPGQVVSGGLRGAFSVYTGPGDPRDFEQSDWDQKVLSILGHYASLAMQSAAQQDALRVAEDQRATTEAFAAIGDIAANLLHRLNNKIGAIPVRVEGIQDKCEAAIQADSYLQKNLTEIERSASEAMQVVRESLFHLHPIQLAPVSVSGSVREALASTRLPSGVRVLREGLDLLPPVQAGPRRLEWVFTNLLDNASDAMGGKGTITIRGWAFGSEHQASEQRPSEPHAGWVEVRVSDTGPGIAPELHEKIFEFNYSSRASSHPGKLGFGLWWVKSLVARFGGTVTVESDGAHGATFVLRLLQAKEEEWHNQ